MDTNSFIQKHYKGTLQITSDISYDVRDVIEDNEKDFHGVFKDKKYSSGLMKIFIKASWIVFRALMQNTDIDTKDANFRSRNGQFLEFIQMMKGAIHFKLQRDHFGSFLNLMRQRCIKHGTAVVKVCGSKLELVNLMNLIVPAHLDELQNGEFVEQVFISKEKMDKRKDRYSKNWKDIEDLWDVMQKDGISEFTLYEHWKHIEIDGVTHKGCVESLDRKLLTPDSDTNTPDGWDACLELDQYATPYKRKTDDGEEEIYPYKEIHFIKADGRWLGFGVFELAKGLQQYINEKMGLYRRKDILDLKGIFKHFNTAKSKSVTQKFFSKIDTGTIIELAPNEDLQRLDIKTSTGEVIAMMDKLMELLQMVVGISSSGVGENMPSTATATVGVINRQAQQTTYDYFIEQQGLFLSELFNDFYSKILLEELLKKEYAPIIGDPVDLQEIDKFLVDNEINDKLTAIRDKELKSPEEMDLLLQIHLNPAMLDEMKAQALQELEKLGDMRFPQLSKKILKYLDFFMEMYVNNESFDTNSQVKFIETSLADPNYPGSREKLYDAKHELIGLNPKRFAKTEQEKMQEAQMAQMAAMQGQGPKTPMGPNTPTDVNQFTRANV